MTSAPLEETALRFVDADDRDGLRAFLEKRLDQLEPMEKTQQTMLVLWLLELHLTELGAAKAGVPTDAAERPAPAAAVAAAAASVFDPVRYRDLRDHFRFFLGRQNVLECMKANSESVYQMMTSHGDVDSLQYFADIMKDYNAVVNLYVQQEHYDEALAVLKKQGGAELFYKYSPSLMAAMPEKLVNAWIEAGAALDPKTLLPAMFHCDQEKAKSEQTRYLEFSIEKLGCRKPAVHNYLLALYSKFFPEKVLPYLKSQGSANVCYDLKYALRLCSEKGLNKACVHVYCVLNLYEEAVQLALKEDVKLAKECVALLTETRDSDFGDLMGAVADPQTEALQKKLWLLIARHVVEHQKDIEQCMELLQESDGLLKIQDLLPFFPEFATIDHFRDSLCACLKEHSGRIKELQREMHEATEVAKDIHDDMAKLKTKMAIVRVKDECGYCEKPALQRAFYAFPCRHHFHIDCLETNIAKHLSEESRQQLGSLRRQLSSVVGPDANATVAETQSVRSFQTELAAPTTSLEHEIRAEIDEIIAAECPWCGEMMINTVDKPFFSVAEYTRELKSWDF